jgi:hypothetical protein
MCKLQPTFAMLDGHWHFQCPECGMGDFELGCLADDQQLFCEACPEEDGRLIRLQRCPTEEPTPAYARFGSRMASATAANAALTKYGRGKFALGTAAYRLVAFNGTYP